MNAEIVRPQDTALQTRRPGSDRLVLFHP